MADLNEPKKETVRITPPSRNPNLPEVPPEKETVRINLPNRPPPGAPDSSGGQSSPAPVRPSAPPPAVAPKPVPPPGGSPAKRAVEVDLALAHDLAKQGGTVERCAVHIGAAQANLNGTYRLNEDSPVISLKLVGSKMALTELAAILPALDVVLPAGSVIERGTLSVDLASLGPIDRLLTSGSIDVDDARLNNFDLGSKMKTIQQLSGIQGEPRTTIQTLTANVAASPEGTIVRNIRVVAPAVGELTGSGTVSPQHALNFQMRATIKASSHILTAIGQKGDVMIPFTIAGTSSDPSFRPDVKGAAKETLQQYTKDPSKAIDTAKGILDMFRKPKNPPPQK